VVTTTSAPPDRVASLDAVATVVAAGDGEVDLSAALARLAADGAQVVLCEGGPSLNADLLAAGCIDEWALTVSPLLVGGPGARATAGVTAPDPSRFTLARLLEADGFLLGRWIAD
jgi:riboflavin biosynthesis pyrimidine reductase